MWGLKKKSVMQPSHIFFGYNILFTTFSVCRRYCNCLILQISPHPCSIDHCKSPTKDMLDVTGRQNIVVEVE